MVDKYSVRVVLFAGWGKSACLPDTVLGKAKGIFKLFFPGHMGIIKEDSIICLAERAYQPG
jgi:hypothetical protein